MRIALQMARSVQLRERPRNREIERYINDGNRRKTKCLDVRRGNEITLPCRCLESRFNRIVRTGKWKCALVQFANTTSCLGRLEIHSDDVIEGKIRVGFGLRHGKCHRGTDKTQSLDANDRPFDI